jgi:CTP synthase (UTP-ammonia lyase)
MTNRIAILGDFNPAYATHHALNDSLRRISKLFMEDLQFDWISTDVFNRNTAFKDLYSGVLVAPGSPYRDMENVLRTITYTREHDIPTFGNCGGFQHMIIEFARTVCGIKSADHEETNPTSGELLISRLSCSLVGQEEELTIVDNNSKLFQMIGKNKLKAKYHCSYGINAKYLDTLKSHGFSTTALSDDGQIRAFELKNQTFFVGTLFQPALTSTIETPDPIIIEFIKKCIFVSKPNSG